MNSKSDNANNFVKAFRLFGVKLNHFNCNIEVSKDESIDIDDDHEEKDD